MDITVNNKILIMEFTFESILKTFLKISIIFLQLLCDKKYLGKKENATGKEENTMIQLIVFCVCAKNIQLIIILC